MEKSIKSKILASVLIFVLGIANFQGIITEGIRVYASSIENQTSKTNHKNVDFNAQFMVVNNDKKYSIRENISNEGIYLNIFTEVKNAGYLKNGKIQIKDKDGKNPNFNLMEIEEPVSIRDIDYNGNEILLNQLNNSEVLDVNIPIKAISADVFDLNNLSKDSIILFNGIYVDGEGKERDIEKEIKLKAEWKEKVEAVIFTETEKVLPFEIEEQTGVVISEKVKLGLKDSKLPIKSAKVEITVPKIGDILPNEVRVENINSVLNINKQYKDGKLNINLENDISEDNTVIWNKSLEELKITYIFENLLQEDVKEVQSIGKIEVECYSGEKVIANAENTNSINIINKLGNRVEEKSESVTEVIYKGNMLNTKEETEFEVVSNIDIAYEKLIEKVEVEYNKDKFVLNEKEIEANTYYKKLVISKEDLSKILGESGEVKIYSGETVLTTIDNTFLADENGNMVFDFTGNVEQFKLETSKPMYNGTLKVKLLKTISGESILEKEEIKNITNLKLETVVDGNIKEKLIVMENPVTKIGLDTNTNILSTVVENKGVEFIVTLNNNSLDEELFKNPKIELALPEDVTNVKVNRVELVLENELEIINYEYIKDSNSIIVDLEGMQTKYNLNETINGATVIINTDITVNNLAVNKKDKIKLCVKNEMSTSYESVLVEKDINVVAPLGLIALNSAEGYDNDQDKATSISGNEAIGKIEPNAENKITTMTITTINNYDSVINNIRILGRVPFKGNKSLVDGSDLGTTFDAILKSKVISENLVAEKFDVYYSENGDATEDINNKDNGWTLDIADLSKVKSYLIILKDYELQIGEKIELKYDIEVPAGLELGNSAHGTYIVYYDNKKDDIVFKNTTVPSVVELTTGEAPKLEVNLSSNLEKSEIARSGQIIRYTVKVKNIGEVQSSQVFITSDIPDGVTYAELVLGGNYADDYYKLQPEKKTFNKLIGDLNVGEEKIVEYLVKVNENIDVQKEIKGKVKLSAKNILEMIESNEVKNTIDNGSILIEIKSDVKEDEKIKIDDTITYIAKVTNISKYDINNVVAKLNIPEGFEYKNAYIKDSDKKSSFKENSNTIEWDLGNIEKGKYNEVICELTAKAQRENIEICIKALGENVEEHKSNILKYNICTPSITVNQETTIPEGFISAGDKIEYNIEVMNSGGIDATNVEIIDFIPQGMKYIETSYEVKGINKIIKNANKNETKLELNIPANETVKMNVKVKADETEKELKATNIVKVINDGVELEANQITHTIEAKTLGNNKNNEEFIELVNTYKISGTAWMDKDANGIKDNNEPHMAGITVMLLDKTNGMTAKDASGQEVITTTEGTGKYTFRNLNKGEYVVVFVYDNLKYAITDYKKSDVEESKNSDVVNMNININGEEKAVAVSDTITISDENIYNINIGLKEIGGFDLKLNKYVSKITVKNNSGVKTYDYNNTKLAKIEVDSKTANGTTLIIEYKISITNEGSMPGYAKKIVDYIPKELKFSSELNSSWYLADDGNVYNSELNNIKINPGESKELSLVLTRQITGENTGLINNNAEISESYNDYGTNDIDSVAGNEKSGEDDISNADILIGIKTGSPVTYIGLSLIIMIALALGAYLINAKILIKD